MVAQVSQQNDRDDVAVRLREFIASGRFVPNERLVEVDLATALKTNRANVRIALQDKDHARVEFVMVNYSGAGKAPVKDFSGPSMVSDVYWDCRREADGQWRLVVFSGEPQFIGGENFISKVLNKD